ncbi:hypothetical protein BOTBODRAFT_182689 [Botryobasidium botryosum FD-172 SS1]|uniref:ERCC1-like central domain-containing protein n=1 Tax=Botryobasidium botryosum (strain FD-172 SS1) TaxID=930990 RepID=A0A067NC58_BOTB1|nr:hypothetical protein BOTBODRAFT_182689 [Botryobasidium botryosum FD-172 SS1]
MSHGNTQISSLITNLKYHRLHPEYIHQRIEKIQGKYNLRILLVMCDVGDQHVDPIRELTKTCLINNLTIMVAWTAEEAAAYLQMYKAYEHKSPDSIKERVENDYSSLLRAALTTIKGVNKTDVMTLRTNFGSMASIAAATAEDLSLCPGLGGVKVRRIKDAFEKPFRNSPGEAVGTQRNTGEERASASSTQLPSSSIARASTSTARLAPAESTRESPPWDLEHGLNSPPPASPNRTTETALASAPPTSDRFSPEWDIEDDNESLGVSSPPAKRLRPSTS